jgi:manganese oxidase
VPGFSGGDADVMPGHTWTYRLTAGPDSVGVWPYHDHSPSMEQSIDGGMFGMLSILGRHDRAPDREFEVVFSQFGNFMAIDGRAFIGNTPIFRAKVGQVVQWDVMAMGSDFHTFPRSWPPLDRAGRRSYRHAD